MGWDGKRKNEKEVNEVYRHYNLCGKRSDTRDKHEGQSSGNDIV